MRKITVRATAVAVASVCLFLGTAYAQGLVGTPGGEFLEEVERELAARPLSLNPAEYLPDSFFDVLVEVVLTEEAGDDVEIPGISDPSRTLPRLTSEEVTQRIRQEMPQLFEALPTLDLTLDGRPAEVPLAPGAAVRKWGHAGRWSRGPHVFDIYTTARVYQWIRASISATNIVWVVFKPGRYSTDCIYLNLHSNGGLRVELENKGPLVGTTASGVNVEIPTEYALSDYVNVPLNAVFGGRTTSGATIVAGWVPDGAQDGADIPAHKLLKLWNYITVGSNVPPGTYSTAGPSAIITVMAQPSAAN